MIIPIKCFTCGKVLADKYLYYIKTVRKKKTVSRVKTGVIYFSEESEIKKTAEALTLDELGLNKMCCRRHMLTHVDIE
jgi:DNA-directed RNA polymerase subunit N (RpoN/RPB10)